MYIELHARSAFSFLEGSSLPEDLMSTCARLNMPAMALLDTDGVYGAPRFHLAAKKLGIKAHIGAEVTCQSFAPVILSEASASRSEALAESKDPYTRQSVQEIEIPRSARNDKPFRLPLLVSSRAGYQNLCRLITKMKLRAKKGEGAVCQRRIGRTCSRPDLPDWRRRRSAGRRFAAGRHRRSPQANRATDWNLSAAAMCTSSCSAISIAKKKLATAPPSRLPGRSIFLCSRPTAFATPPRKIVNSATHSPPSAITAHCQPPDGCWRAIPSVT